MCRMLELYNGLSIRCDKRDYSAGKVASKCDLCVDEDIPVCVKNCPNEALKFFDTGEK